MFAVTNFRTISFDGRLVLRRRRHDLRIHDQPVIVQR